MRQVGEVRDSFPHQHLGQADVHGIDRRGSTAPSVPALRRTVHIQQADCDASSAPMTPAATPAALTGRAGLKKGTSPSRRHCCARAWPGVPEGMAGGDAHLRAPGAAAPGAQLTLVEAKDGWRYSLQATNRPAAAKGWLGQAAYMMPRTGYRSAQRMSSAPARTPAWATSLRLPGQHRVAYCGHDRLDPAGLAQVPGPGRRPGQSRTKTLGYQVLPAAARLVRGGGKRHLKSRPPGRGPGRSRPPGSASTRYRMYADQHNPSLRARKEHPRARRTPGDPARQPGYCHTRTANPDPRPATHVGQCRPSAPVKE